MEALLGPAGLFRRCTSAKTGSTRLSVGDGLALMRLEEFFDETSQ